jgi:uncharacterized membrane protein
MYLTLKALHILAVILFLGNTITGAFWKAHGDKSGDPKIIAHTLDGIIRSDRFFTIPGVIMILLFGFGAAGIAHYPILSTGWIWMSLILFGISGASYMRGVVPAQIKLRNIARDGAISGRFDKAEYERLSRRWAFWGTIAIVTPLGALALMVSKPAF